MAARTMNITGMVTPVARRSVAGITPEFYFQKTIDNSRLVRQADPQRRRELRSFSMVLSLFFLLTIFYTWQHFRSLQYGYEIEAQKKEHEQLLEQNRKLALDRSGLRDPERIDLLARQMSLEPTRPDQVVQLEPPQRSGAVVAQASPVTMVPAVGDGN